MKQVLSQDFIATERRQVVLESIDGLRDIQRHRVLSLTERAALVALTQIHSRCISTRGSVIPYQSMARPVAIAQRAIELEAVPCAQ
jgi:hypothetical protein